MAFPHRKLRLEQLEDRCLMTAVVTQLGGTVQITGTDNPLDDFDQDETIIVRQRDEFRFKILGNVVGGPVIVDGVDRLEVALGEGVDQLIINGRQIKEGLDRGMAIDMGAGADGVRIKGLGVAGLVEILRDEVDGEVSSEPEVITIEDSRFVGGTNISTGDGVDQVRIFGGSRLRAFANISTGDGNDFVFLADSIFGQTSVDMGEGDDDELEVFGNLFNGFASFVADGDEDSDEAEGDGNVFNAGVEIVGFEVVI